jgi:hypothetical protein
MQRFRRERRPWQSTEVRSGFVWLRSGPAPALRIYRISKPELGRTHAAIHCACIGAQRGAGHRGADGDTPRRVRHTRRTRHVPPPPWFMASTSSRLISIRRELVVLLARVVPWATKDCTRRAKRARLPTIVIDEGRDGASPSLASMRKTHACLGEIA